MCRPRYDAPFEVLTNGCLVQSGACMTERQAALVMHEVLTTLAACHENSVYHGDVKPANFMLTQQLDSSRPLEDLER